MSWWEDGDAARLDGSVEGLWSGRMLSGLNKRSRKGVKYHTWITQDGFAVR